MAKRTTTKNKAADPTTTADKPSTPASRRMVFKGTGAGEPLTFDADDITCVQDAGGCTRIDTVAGESFNVRGNHEELLRDVQAKRSKDIHTSK